MWKNKREKISQEVFAGEIDNTPKKRKTFNKKIRIISTTALLLASLITASTVLAGCKPKNENYQEFSSSQITVTDTIHEVYVGTTSYKMVENGATKYKLLVTPEDEMNYSEAINEFKDIFQQSTGIMIQVEKDNGVGFSENATYISLGETSAFAEAEIDTDYETLGSQGYQIVTKGKSIFVTGKKLGILFGVYDLLNKLVDYEMYTTLNPYVKRNLKEIPFRKRYQWHGCY